MYCDAKAQPEVHYATRFAAKEAVVKALGTRLQRRYRRARYRGATHVEGAALRGAHPAALVRWRAIRASTRSPSRFPSRTPTPSPAPWPSPPTPSPLRKKRVDPMEELARQFKDARAMLDDLPAQSTPSPASPSAPSADAVSGDRAEGGASACMRIERRRKRASRRGCGRRRRRAVRDAGRIAFRGRADDVPRCSDSPWGVNRC